MPCRAAAACTGAGPSTDLRSVWQGRHHVGRRDGRDVSLARVGTSVGDTSIGARIRGIRVQDTGIRSYARVWPNRIHARIRRSRIRRHIDPVGNYVGRQVRLARIGSRHHAGVRQTQVRLIGHVRTVDDAVFRKRRVGQDCVGRGRPGHVSRCVPRNLDSSMVAPAERQSQAHRCRHDQLACRPLEEALDALPDLAFLHGSGTLYDYFRGGCGFSTAGVIERTGPGLGYLLRQPTCVSPSTDLRQLS